MKTLAVKSKLSFDESILSLQNLTNKSQTPSLVLEKRTRGRTDSDSVYLYRSQTMFGNPYKPVFVGKLIKEGDEVVLKGKFSTHIFGKVILTIWVMLVSIMIGYMVFDAYVNNPSNFFNILTTAIGIYVMFISAGIISLAFGRFLAGDDVEYLSNKIHEALN